MLAQVKFPPDGAGEPALKGRDPNMRFQVSCAPTHAKFLVDSNLNKSVLINLIMENHYGECLEDPSGFPTRLLSPCAHSS